MNRANDLLLGFILYNHYKINNTTALCNLNTTPGVAFDAGQTLSSSERNRLRETASSFGLWSYVEPASLTPTWVHFDKRSFPSACSSGGYLLII